MQKLTLHSCLLVVFLVGSLIYCLGLDGPLFFDDHSALTANKSIHISGANFEEWRLAALSSNSGPTGRPIAMLSFAANYAVEQQVSATGLKAVNLCIHLFTGWLVFLIARRVLFWLLGEGGAPRADVVAMLATAIWILHPLHVSTVLYAVQRMALLSAAFMCLGLYIYLCNRDKWACEGAAPGDLFASALWILLAWLGGVLSKENALVLPGLIVWAEICLYKGKWRGEYRKSLEMAAIGVALVAGLVFLYLIIMPPETLTNRYLGREFTLDQRLLTQARLLWQYVGWLTIPDITNMGFQHDDIEISNSILQPWTTLLSIAAWIALFIVAMKFRSKFPVLLFSFGFYLIGHSLESSIWPLEMVYEHRNYLPSIGVAIFLAVAVFWLVGVARSRVINMFPGLLVLMLAGLLLVRVDTWGDELRLMAVNAKHHPESSRSNYFYGDALLKEFQRHVDEHGRNEDAAYLLISARSYFERMHLTNPRDMVAIVMLFFIDSRYFPNLLQANDWLLKLEKLSEDRVFQVSDRNALRILVDCYAIEKCTGDEDKLERILLTLKEMYPRSLPMLANHYQFMKFRNSSPENLEVLIDEALSISPGNTDFLYQSILVSSERGDVAGMYQAAQNWLFYDESRERLNTLNMLFAP